MVKKKKFQPEKKTSAIRHQLSDHKKRRVENLSWWKWILIVLISFLTFHLSLLTFNLFLADVSFAQGLAAKRHGDLESAAESFKEAVKLNPREPAYERELAGVYAELSQVEEAAKHAAQAYKLNPLNSLTLKSLLKTYFDLSKIDEKYQVFAEAVASDLVSLSPNEARVNYSAALVFAAGGKEEKALELCEQALELKPDFSEAKELARILAEKEEP